MSHRIELDSADFREVFLLVVRESVDRITLATLKECIVGESGNQKFRKERLFCMDPMEYLEVVKNITSTNKKVIAAAQAIGIDCGVVRESEFKFSFVIGPIRTDYDLDPITRKGSIVMRDRLDEIKEIETKAQDYIKSLVNSR